LPELAVLSPQIIGLAGIPTLPKNFLPNTAITPVRLLVEQGGRAPRGAFDDLAEPGVAPALDQTAIANNNLAHHDNS
jgi:hypothetical protein